MLSFLSSMQPPQSLSESTMAQEQQLRKRGGTKKQASNVASTRDEKDSSSDESEDALLIPKKKITESKNKDKDKERLSLSSFHITPNDHLSYWLSSLLLLRSIAFIYLIAFCVAYFQNIALIGTNGIYPFDKHLNKMSNYMSSTSSNSLLLKWFEHPTLFWFIAQTNDSLNNVALCGIIISSLILIFGNLFCHSLVFLVLWLLYHTLVNVGQLFYGYGWESQLLETGFLAIFLCRWSILPYKTKQSKDKKKEKDKTKEDKSKNKNENKNIDETNNDDDDHVESIVNWLANDDNEFNYTPPVPPSKILQFLYLWFLFRIMIGK